MNHQKIYDSIIQRAKSENRVKLRKTNSGYIYYENHHIIPRCLGGSNDKENLVLLTAREHFVCHKLLIFIYNFNKGLCDAYLRMTFSKQLGDIKSSRDYDYAKWLKSNIPISEETREKLSLSHKGKITWMKGKHHSEETRKKLQESSRLLTGDKNSFYGKQHSEKTKQRISESRKGKSAWNKGIPTSEESKLKNKESQTGEKHWNYGKKLSEETKQKLRKPHGSMSEEHKKHLSESLRQRKLNSNFNIS